MLHIENLWYKINNYTLIKNLNLKANKGIYIIFGPSGTGKTSLFKIITGLAKPTKGFTKYKGILGIFFQNYNLLTLDVQTNLNLPFYFNKIKKDQNWENYLINYFEIKQLIHKDIEQISDGEKERVGIIKAFIHKPNIVLLDEVGNSLNTNLKIKLLKLIIDYSKNNLILRITHDLFIKNYFKNQKMIYDYNFKIFKIKNDN